MLVLLGNSAPHQAVTDEKGNRSFKAIEGGPRVTRVHIPEGDGAYSHDKGDHTGESLARHLLVNRDVTKLGEGLEPFLSIAHPDQGHWGQHSPNAPTWVWSDNEDLGRLLADFYGCQFGAPADVNETHVTHGGGVPQEAIAR